MKLSSVRFNHKKAQIGAPVPLGQFDSRLDGLTVTVRAFGNKDDQVLIDRQKRALGTKDPTQDELFDAMTDRLVETLLVGWDGLETENDEPVPFSGETAREILSDRDFGVFRQGVVWACSQVTNGEAASLKYDSGN